MYHALALEDMCDLINILRAFPESVPEKHQEFVVSWSKIVQRMLGWLQTLCHPDGDIVLFNDAAFGIAPQPSQLTQYCLRLGIQQENADRQSAFRVTHLSDTGYIRVDAGEAAAFLDAAPIGPDYLPGHAHADNLTLEMSYQGQRLLVDTGVSHYTLDEERLRQRGTGAHNTVRIDGLDSSEVWSGFRVARRARPTNTTEIGQEGESIWVRAGHDGYARLPGKVLHNRSLLLKAQEAEVLDELGGEGKHKLELFWHFHPDVSLVREDG